MNPSSRFQQVFTIRVKGHLSPAMQADWFGDVIVTNQENGEAQIVTPSSDQAFLFGVLLRLRDLGIAVIAICPADGEPKLMDQEPKG